MSRQIKSLIRALAGVILCLSATFMSEAKSSISKSSFGRTARGEAVAVYTLTNERGASARIMTYGGAVVSLNMPDRAGKFDDIVLGFDSVSDYERQGWYVGALIGRYGNRIGRGKFSINGRTYQLATNNGANHLHGGVRGFDKVVWKARPFLASDGPSLELRYTSPDGDQGYPGKLTVKVTYALTNENELRIIYDAVSDQDTLCNLTHHSYFNLAGKLADTILDHKLMIDANQFTPTDAGSIPTGELATVAGTPFDFRQPTRIGERIDNADEQLKFGSGYDHNWVLNRRGNVLARAAVASEPLSGRVMEVLTTEPGLQFYAGNFLDESIPGKGGRKYPRRSGFCLEAQGFPDSPNKTQFPSTVLKKGERYSQTTIYRFSAQ